VAEDELPTYIGPLEPFEFIVGERCQRNYLAALEDHHPRYISGRPGRSPFVHPAILLNNSNATRSPSFGGPNANWLHTREETRFKMSAHLGERLVVCWHVDKHKPWANGVLTRVSCVISRSGGPVILSRVMWGFRSAGRIGGGTGADRRLAATRPSTGFPRPTDDELTGRRKNVTRERIGLFSSTAAHNLHTSDQIAKAAGLAAPVASAAQGMGYLCEFMIDNFGEKWLSGGSWVLAFRKPIFPADEVTVLGRLTSAGSDVASAQRVVRVRLMNQHGTTVTEGSAACHEEL
jgi:acyl dehydratase